MSKMDNLRAMREARYAESMKRASGATAKPSARPPVAPVTPKATTKQTPEKAEVAGSEAAAPDAEELCGHRNMSGRTCTREKGHSAKSHRYS